MKPCIINILPHEPDYRFKTDDPRPPVNWDTPDGNWVGIYNNEIPNKLGREVLRYTDQFAYEVWQPDYRADKVYSHTFKDGLVHRLFPAHRETVRYGFKQRQELRSPALVTYLQDCAQQRPVVVNLNGDINPLSMAVIEIGRDFPIVQTFRGTLHLPKTMAFKLRLNIPAGIQYWQRHQALRQIVPNVDYVTYQNSEYYQQMKELFRVPAVKLTSGCNFSFWHHEDQDACREAVGLPNKLTFFTSSLLQLRKQVDRVIEILSELDADYDFMLVISGHGTEQYEQYLRQLAQPLITKDKIRFVGYVTGKELRNYYNSADLFINSSAAEGGPVSAMKAIACETPVFATNSGNVAERMRDNDSGILVGTQAYEQWKKAIKQFMDGTPVKKFDRAEAESYYDWQKIAASFAKIYHQLSLRYDLYK